MTASATAAADQSAGRRPTRGDQPRPPVYQRQAFEWKPGHHNKHGNKRGHGAHWFSPPVNAGWFQRPYPYHLDYYRMRYGGSYAPYFGNLYGPPQVVTAPPYYGAYYGEYFQPPGAGFNGGYGGPIGFAGQGGEVASGGPAESSYSKPANASTVPSNGEYLPPPAE
jgi:hypothetical protein